MTTLAKEQDALIEPLEELHQDLAAEIPGREREWAEDMSRSVARLRGALHRRQAAAAAPDGLFAQVDLTRSTLARQVGALRQRLAELLEQANSLHRELNAAAEAFLPAAAPPQASPLPPPAASRAIPDFSALRREAEQLLEALGQYREEETRLILESVNTEIGVGD
jgi:hypothetical protein